VWYTPIPIYALFQVSATIISYHTYITLVFNIDISITNLYSLCKKNIQILGNDALTSIYRKYGKLYRLNEVHLQKLNSTIVSR